MTDELPFEDEQFDVVVLNGAQVSAEGVREIHRVLRTGGRLFFSVSEKRCGSADGYTSDEIYRRFLMWGYNVLSVERAPWWRFGFGNRTMTICASKKAWKERAGLASGPKAAIFAVLVGVLVLPAVATPMSHTSAATPMSHTSAIVRLLNSRSAGKPDEYEAAARIVRADCDALRADGTPAHPLQRYVIALVSDDPDAPEAAKIGAAKRAEYLDSARAGIRRLAEDKNNPLAWYLLSLENNDMSYLRRASDAGNVQALNAMGTYVFMRTLRNSAASTNEVTASLAEAFACFSKAAKLGDVNGLYNVGMCRMNGYGCDRDEKLAFRCFKEAAAAGHPEAINNIGGFYRDGIVVARDLKVAAEHFAQSAAFGNHYGELNYALALQRGEGVARNERMAAAYLKRAAEAGNAEAMNVYGMCFYNGSGVARNPAMAFAWFMRSANAGFPPAMDNIAVCYDKGCGVAMSHQLATIWKVRARANSGDRPAADWLRKNGYPLR